ncbi:MAG TPA: PEP-CTERM sorting domain-containing protein [Leptolyngbyaceae cyanobacterium]
MATVVAAVVTLGTVSKVQAETFTFSIDSRATFLRTAEDPLALNSVPIDLSSLGISSGDLIRLEQLGDFSYWSNPIRDYVTNMIGVFSASDALLPSYLQNRVQDAIDSGEDVFTLPTSQGGGNLPTDIAQDFLISDITLQVPTSATYLFVAAPDIYYSDNVDPDRDFGIRISSVSQSVPEPTSILGLLAFGISVSALQKRKQQ